MAKAKAIKKRRTHPHVRDAIDYAKGVVSGEILAATNTILACQRFLTELEEKDFPYKMNKDRAERFCEFAELMPHVKGEWAGKNFVMEPWQSFIYVNLFGWVDRNGFRRFRKAFIFVTRKMGKTFMVVPIGLGMMTVEAEPGAEIYCGAMNEAQANEVFRPAKAMANRAAGFKEAYGIQVAASSIFCGDGLSFFQRLIGKPGDGQSPYCAIHDEYHQHNTSEQVDAMDTGMGARKEPLQIIVTTAGKDTSSPCKDLYDYAVDVLKGVYKNDKFFVQIYECDKDDDWTDWKSWIKANPNLGVSVSEEYLRDKLNEAIQRPSQQNIIQTKHLNRWVNAGVGWLNIVKWSANARPGIKLEDFRGCKAWIGIDLASKIDLAAMMTLIWKEGCWYLFGKYYLPEETIELPENAHYQTWVLEGLITETPGARIDFHYMYRDLLESDEEEGTECIYDILSVQEIVYDPREAEYVIQDIREAVSCPVVELTQSAANLSEPMKEFEAIVNDGTLIHDGDKVLHWAAGNVVLKSFVNKMYYPAKEQPKNKIDPIVAALIALARAKATVEDDEVKEGFVAL